MLMIHDIPTPLNFFFVIRETICFDQEKEKERGYNADAKLLNFQINSE